METGCDGRKADNPEKKKKKKKKRGKERVEIELSYQEIFQENSCNLLIYLHVAAFPVQILNAGILPAATCTISNPPLLQSPSKCYFASQTGPRLLCKLS